MVIASGQQVSVEVGIPRQTVALLLVSSKPQVRLALSVGVGLAGMLGVIEDEDVARRSLCGNDTRVLGHISSTIHLPLVVDLDLNLNLACKNNQTNDVHCVSSWFRFDFPMS